MGEFLVFCKWLDHTSVGTAIRESLWLFPIIETVHIFGIISLVGGTSILDLRLMGLTFRDEPVTKLAKRFLPWAWFGFMAQVVTGLLMFSSEATKCYTSWFFRLKMGLLILAGLNALIYHFGAYRSIASWDGSGVVPAGARVAAWTGLIFWVLIVFAGRGIAYY